MALICPTCAEPIPSSSIVAGIDAARCPKCAELVDLRAKTGAFPRRAAIEAPIPLNWSVAEASGRFHASFRWLKVQTLVMIPFALFWNGILGVAAYAATDGGAHLERLLFGLVIPHVWVGAGLLYAVITGLLNRTTIEAGVGSVRVSSGPIPSLSRNVELSASDIQQIFVVDHAGKSSHSYDVCAVLRDGRKKVLVRSLDSQDQAAFLESRLEKILAIDDRPVEGEAARRAIPQATSR